jgi:hypothetical protein|nr:MAG TPA_asm: hypothetical protein [Caudoviricetes sp.]
MPRRKSIKKQMEEEKKFEPVETMDGLDMADQDNKPVDKKVQSEPVVVSDKFVKVVKKAPVKNDCLYFKHKGKLYKKLKDNVAVCCSDGSVIDIPKGE